MFDQIAYGIWTILSLYVAVNFIRSIRIVPNRQAYIVERLGRYHSTWGPGFHFGIPFIDKVAFIQDLKEEAIEVPPQECFTKDNVRVEVDGVLYISVTHPENASYGVTNYRGAARVLAQTTTRSVIGTLDLDRTFEEREAINSRVLGVISEVSESWGINVHRYEVKNIEVPGSVRDAMERQLTAERDRRALLARTEGQKQAMINDSEGLKIEMINKSEGEMTKRINEAEGRAEEILAVAKATADSIREVGQALCHSSGQEAIKLQLAQAFIKNLGHLADAQTQVLLPADFTKLDDILSSVGLKFSEGLPSVDEMQNILMAQGNGQKVPTPEQIVENTNEKTTSPAEG